MQELALRLQIGGDLLELCKDRGVVGFPGRRVVWISVHDQQHESHRESSMQAALNERALNPREEADRPPYISQTWRTSIWKNGGNFLAHSMASASDTKSPR